MKKLFMMVALMLSLSTATFAGENDYTKIMEIDSIPSISYSLNKKVDLNYNFELNYLKLGEYLRLTEDDLFDFRRVHEGFCSGMMLASEATTLESRNNLIFNSIDHELRLMKSILTDKQYRKFLRVFNISLQNRGFSYIINTYDVRNKA